MEIQHEPHPQRWRWTTERLQPLSDLGFFAVSERVELLQGEIIRIPPPAPRHSGIIAPLYEILKSTFGTGFALRSEQPLTVDEENQPQPDMVVCVGSNQTYFNRFPTASDVRLIVEVAESSLRDDQTIKAPLYAQANLPEYWILNLRENILEVYREPDGTQYRNRRLYTLEEEITPLSASTPVSIREILGLTKAES